MSTRKVRRYEGTFAMLPDEVLTSDAGRTLPHPALTVLVAIAAQFYGKNNGSLTLPRGTAAKYGLGNPYTLDRALRELEERELVLRTKPGSQMPPRAAMFALTWRPIDAPNPRDPHDARPTLSAPNQWAAWRASKAERHWIAPENEKRVAQKQRAMQPRDTRTCSPGLHGNAEISSPGLHVGRSKRVAQGYGSYISGVGDAGKTAAPSCLSADIERQAIALLVQEGHSPRSASTSVAALRRDFHHAVVGRAIKAELQAGGKDLRHRIRARCKELLTTLPAEVLT